jgi:hypothetical protein
MLHFDYRHQVFRKKPMGSYMQNSIGEKINNNGLIITEACFHFNFEWPQESI